jgi:hypothetical protein
MEKLCGDFLWRTRIIKGNQEEKNYIGSIEVIIECWVWCKRKQICTSKLGMRNVTEIFFFLTSPCKYLNKLYY